jgi:hypothetical protein
MVNTIQSALAKGNGFISNFRRGDARGTLIELIDSNNDHFLSGINSKLPLLPAEIRVKIPKEGLIRLIRNGTFFEENRGNMGSFKITRDGSYRVEVFRKQFGWIYSNHFIVGSYPFSE